MVDGVCIYVRYFVLVIYLLVGFNLVQVEMEVYCEYGVVVLVVMLFVVGIYWIVDWYCLLCGVCGIDGCDWLVLVGEIYCIGEMLFMDLVQYLVVDVYCNFIVQGELLCWFVQQFCVVDQLFYIGSSVYDNVWLVIGYGLDGLIWVGVVVCVIIEGIIGMISEIEQLFSFMCFILVCLVVGWVCINGMVVWYMVGDCFVVVLLYLFIELVCGCGVLLDVDGKWIVVYCDEGGCLYMMLVFCLYLKCVV